MNIYELVCQRAWQWSADAVNLSDNPYEMDVGKMDSLKVEQLFLNDEPYQKIAQKPIGQVLKGITHRQS